MYTSLLNVDLSTISHKEEIFELITLNGFEPQSPKPAE